MHPASRFKEAVAERARGAGRASPIGRRRPGRHARPARRRRNPPTRSSTRRSSLTFDRAEARRDASSCARPTAPVESTPDAILAAGDQFWPLRAFRELDDALLRLRVNEPEIGTVVLKTEGDPARVLEADAVLLAQQDHWFVREVMHFIKRTLKRVDLSARSFFALIEPGNAFAGTLFELALAADRSYMLDDPDQPNAIQLSGMNAGPLPMSNGLTRLADALLRRAGARRRGARARRAVRSAGSARGRAS